MKNSKCPPVDGLCVRTRTNYFKNLGEWKKNGSFSKHSFSLLLLKMKFCNKSNWLNIASAVEKYDRFQKSFFYLKKKEFFCEKVEKSRQMVRVTIESETFFRLLQNSCRFMEKN